MRKSEHMSLISDHDYHNIEETITKTEMGRRFLAEYTQRNRAHDTLSLLEIIKRFENAVLKYGKAETKNHTPTQTEQNKNEPIIFINGEKPKNQNQINEKKLETQI